jgi:hypothetical protein
MIWPLINLMSHGSNGVTTTASPSNHLNMIHLILRFYHLEQSCSKVAVVVTYMLSESLPVHDHEHGLCPHIPRDVQHLSSLAWGVFQL